MLTEIQKQNLKAEFIEWIKDLGGLIDDIVFRPYSLSINRMYYPRSTYNYKLNKFKTHGLIKKRPTNNSRASFVLSEKGKSLLKKPKFTQKRTDGFSTLILFDIPEEQHRQRNIFRRYLLRNGYIQIQKSALVGPVKISSELKELVEDLKLTSYIKVISAKIDQL